MRIVPSFAMMSLSTVRRFAILLRNVDSLFSHFVERGKLAQLGDDLHHLVDDVVDFLLRIETAEAEADRRVSQVFADP